MRNQKCPVWHPVLLSSDHGHLLSEEGNRNDQSVFFAVQSAEGLRLTWTLFTFLNRIWSDFLASLQQLKHLHKLAKLLRERVVCPGNAAFSVLCCEESRCLTSWNLGISGEIAFGRNLNK